MLSNKADNQYQETTENNNDHVDFAIKLLFFLSNFR